MLHVDEQPETLHIYVVRDEVRRPQLYPIFLSVLALASLVALSLTGSYQQPVTRAVIRVPAVLLPVRTFTARVAVIPTGVRTYPATIAHGILTITNGSIIGQSIPAGFTIQGVTTDSVVYVPPGNANGYGWAQVEAHAVATGQSGNLPPYTINSVIGSSVYIRNLSAFRGGHDGYLVKHATALDTQTAISKARQQLNAISSGLRYPCIESSTAAALVWRCQFVTYHLPALYHVTGVRIVGKNLIISAWFVARPRLWVK